MGVRTSTRQTVERLYVTGAPPSRRRALASPSHPISRGPQWLPSIRTVSRRRRTSRSDPQASQKVTVLIDALNVARSQWPNISRDKLVDLCWSWGAEQGHEVVVVFDGAAPIDVVGERRLGPGCRVVGSGRRSADAWIEREARRLRDAGAPYWLVTSDRVVRSVAGASAVRTIGGGTFARELTGDASGT